MLHIINDQIQDLPLDNQFVVPIFKSMTLHPALNKPCAVFFLHNDRSFVYNIDHPGIGDYGTLEELNDLLGKLNVPVVVSMHDAVLGGMVFNDLAIDLATSQYHSDAKIDPKFSQFKPSIFSDYTKKFPQFYNISYAVPVLKLLEYARAIYDTYSTAPLQILNNRSHYWLYSTLAYAERAGIYVNYEKFKEFYPHARTDSKGLLYSYYNPLTTTGRATNSYGRINFSALAKDSGVRNTICSRYGEDGVILMLDYESFHLQLLGMLVNHRGISHNELAKIYYNTDSPTPEQYEESKKRTFAHIYGYSEPSADDPEFFKRAFEYKKSLYSLVVSRGGKLLSSFGLDRNVTGESPEKIFNYNLQDAEAWFTMGVLSDLKGAFEHNSQIHPVLYVYDSFVFDLHKSQLDNVVEIQRIVSKEGTVRIKTYIGDTYGTLTPYE